MCEFSSLSGAKANFLAMKFTPVIVLPESSCWKIRLRDRGSENEKVWLSYAVHCLKGV